MRRPLADKRPIGPFSQFTSSGECRLRMKILYEMRSMPTEVDQSLRRSIENELEQMKGGLGMPVSFDNITFTKSPVDNRIEVALDLVVKETDTEIEDEVTSSIGAALIDGGGEGPRVEDITYSAVAR